MNFMKYEMLQDIRNVDEVSYPELVIGGKNCLCFCSNNYLGLSIHPEVKRSAIEAVERYGIGTCESRLIAGNLTILEELERAIAEFQMRSRCDSISFWIYDKHWSYTSYY